MKEKNFMIVIIILSYVEYLINQMILKFVWVMIDKLPDNIMPTQIEYIEKFENSLV